MSRYVESIGNFLYRAPISVDITAGGAGVVDVSCLIPPAWPEFWNTVLATGADIRVTLADGTTLCTYDLQGFVHATKTLTVEVDNVDMTAVGSHMGLLWLHWGNANAVDAKTAFVPVAPKTGYVTIEVPSAAYVMAVVPERQGQTKAQAVWVKQVGETVDVYFDFGAVLRKRALPYGGSRAYEEISFISLQDVQLALASQGSMITVANARLCEAGWAKIQVKGGASAVTYTVICQVTTTLGEVLEGRARLFVQNTSEA